MQIVIDIHEKDFECLKRTGRVTYSLISGVLKGIVLPKGHGRLIDADALKLTRHDIHVEEIDYYHRCVSIENIDNAKTIIEADAESEGKE